MMLPPLTPRENAKAVVHPLMYVTYLSAAKEASSSHITKKCVPNFYTALNYPYFQPLYTANPSCTRAAEYQREGYIREAKDWIQGVKYSYGYYVADTTTP